jgi:hypothetical protein
MSGMISSNVKACKFTVRELRMQATLDKVLDDGYQGWQLGRNAIE